MVRGRFEEDEESIISADEPVGCHAFEILEVFVLFALHIADIVMDFLLIIGYFQCQNHCGIECEKQPLLTALAILGIVFTSSFFAAIFERKSKAASGPEPDNGFLFYFWGFVMFVFNFSGILMFAEALYKLCRKSKTTNDELRTMQHNLVYLKMIEGFIESLPQFYVHFVLVTKQMETKCPNQARNMHVKLVLAYIGILYTIIHYTYHVTPNITGVFNKMFRALWIFFMSVSWVTTVVCLMKFLTTHRSSTPIVLYMHILFTGCVCISFNLSRKPVVMIVLSFLCMSQYFFPDEFTDSDAEKDRFLVTSHILHFIEMVIITLIWHFAYNRSDIYYYYFYAIYFIIGCYIVGEFFYIIFQIRLKNNKILEVRRINRPSRQERVSLISLRPINHSFRQTGEV